MRLKNFKFNNYQTIIFILVIATILRLIHLKHNYALWWDSSIYLAVAKYIYTFGANGLWEPYRPLIHPIILGFFWKIGANIVIVGKFFDLIFSLSTIFLSFKITEKLYSKIAGFYTAFLLAIEPLFIMYTGLILTEPLAISISLFAIYLFINKKTIFPKLKRTTISLLIGLVASFATLTKFPLGMIIVSIFLARHITHKFAKQKYKFQDTIKEVKDSLWYCIGFAIPLIPYLIFNYLKYQDPLLPFTSGTWIISTFLWMYDTNFWFYFTNFFSVHKVFLLLIISIFLFFKNKEYKDEGKTTIFLSAVFIFCYFWFQVPRKEVRYLVLAMPFFAILMGPALVQIQNKISLILNSILSSILSKLNHSINSIFLNSFIKKILSKVTFITASLMIITIILFQSAPTDSVRLTYSEYQEPLEKLGNFIEDQNFEGMVLVSSPYIAEFIDNALFPTAGVNLAEKVYEHEYGRFESILLVDCDYYCHKSDQNCQDTKKKFLSRIDQEQLLLYFDTYSFKHQECQLFFYQVVADNITKIHYP